MTLPRALGIIDGRRDAVIHRAGRERSRFSVLAFILRRILQSVAVMAVVAFIAFGLFNFTGDPVTFMVGQDATQEERRELRADLGLDQPFYVQFGALRRSSGPG